MTTVILDESHVISSGFIPSRILGSERNVIKVGQKGKILRADSPTTLRACQDLGLVISDLKQKTFDDFKVPNVEEEIIQIRFQHYIKKYNQIIKDVLNKKKQIAQKIKDETAQQAIPQHFSQRDLLTSSYGHPFRTKSTGNSPKELKTPYSSLIPAMTNKAMSNFNKTISGFRKSSEYIDIETSTNAVDPSENEVSPIKSNPFEKLNKTLSQEIFKFSQTKIRQQKNARMRYESEVRRLDMFEEIKEKEKRKEQIEKMKISTRMKSESEKKKIQEERVFKIKQLKRDFKVQKEEERKKMVVKFEDAKRNFENQVGERNKSIAERREQEDQKYYQAFKRREKFFQEEIERADSLGNEISRRINSKQQVQKANLTEISMRAKVELNKVHERVNKSKEKLAEEEEGEFQKLIQRLQIDEDKMKRFNLKYSQSLKNKEEEQNFKHQAFMSNHKEVENNLKRKLKSIDDKFLRTQKNIEKKRELEEKNRRMKQEIARLKTEDKKEMHTRLERQLENQRSMILNKERLEQERLFWISTQKELAQKAQRKAAIQSKFENDRLNDSVERLTRTLYTSNSSKGFNKYQNRLLKDLYSSADPLVRFREQDLTQFEEEE